MTKDEERAVLLKIEKALSAAEPDGYIAKAFEGCVALAHENIDNDWGISPLDWKNSLYEREREIESINSYRAENATTLTMQAERIRDQSEKISELARETMELSHRATDAEEKVQVLENEVTKLKARLFDMMEGGSK